MTSYTGVSIFPAARNHIPKSTLIAAGVLAVGLVCVMTLADLLPASPQTATALLPPQSAGLLRDDPSVPSAAKVFDGRIIGLEDSAPTI